MFSRRVLGIFALAAVVLAAICFAAVDVSIANANGCVGVSGPCSETTMPLDATILAIVGTVALLLSVIPAITWFTAAIHHHPQEADAKSASLARVSYREEEDL